MDEHLKEYSLSSNLLYQNSFLSISQDQIRLPNGQENMRVVVRHPGAACILAITEQEQVVLVRQWRYAADQALLEIPAGKLDVGEDAAQCALRELAEETPYTACQIEKIAEFYTAPGFCDEIMHLYRASGLQKNSTLKPDQDEFVETILMNRFQVQTAIQNGEIKDAKTLIALQFWLMETK